MADKTYKLTEAQRLIIHDSLNHCIQHGLFRPGYAREFAEVFDLFTEEHPEPDLGWNDPRFDEEDRAAIIESLCDEIRDVGPRDHALEQVESLTMVELIGYVFPDDTEDLVSMLQHLDADEDSYVNGEFLRENDNDGDDYSSLLDFAKRMKLINEEETELTELGKQFVKENS